MTNRAGIYVNTWGKSIKKPEDHDHEVTLRQAEWAVLMLFYPPDVSRTYNLRPGTSD